MGIREQLAPGVESCPYFITGYTASPKKLQEKSCDPDKVPSSIIELRHGPVCGLLS